MERLWMRPSGLCLWLMLLCSVGYTQAQTGIIAAEYFFDVDPGVGAANSIPITPGLDTLDVSALQVSFSNAVPGMHYMVVRVLHAQYGWGIGASGSIFVTDSFAGTVSLQPAPVVWAEYFFGSDPGCGNGLPLLILPGDTTMGVFSISLGGLPVGIHRLNLRTRDLLGRWSFTRSGQIDVISPSCSPAIPDFSVGSNAQPGSSVLLSSTSQNVDSNTTYGWYVGDVRGLISPSSSDFEQNTQGWNVTDVFSFQGSNVLGPFINQSISYNQSGLSPHVSKTISFDLYAHDTWDGDEPFTFSVNGQSLGTFYFNPYAVWCCDHTPLTYPQVVYQGQVGGRCWGTPSSVYRVRFTIPDTSSSLSFSIDQSNGEWL
ncbi:MAG: hypothetical protein ACKO6M_06760, partial [Bacteroidota bacterium]